MTHAKIGLSALTALAFVGVTACGGQSNAPPPQTPADQTTTTAAEPSNPPTTAAVQPSSGSSGTMAQDGKTNGSMMNGSPLSTTAGTSLSAGAASTDSSSAGGAADTNALSDGQIVAVVQAADTGEIDQAREALHKGKNGRVKQFAQHMVTDHSAAETKLSSLDTKVGITPQTNAVAESIKSGGDKVMSDLKAANGKDFDKAYIDAQVNEHTKVLDLLDNKLIPHAQNADLTKTLQDIRSKVAGHLKMAQEIQSSLAR